MCHLDGAGCSVAGARYIGEWSGNIKQGHGLFSFEDGSVYEGPFDEDRMTDGQVNQRHISRGTSVRMPRGSFLLEFISSLGLISSLRVLPV